MFRDGALSGGQYECALSAEHYTGDRGHTLFARRSPQRHPLAAGRV